ncbi:hypothetical protein [Roseomonas elaeocarpi]|uniref:Chromosome partitioning protein ParB n=1 Tax=Roseomonas elaeocarpi TaxID=907779 RepID=A0ABV6JQG2_9PROT
MGSLFSAPKPVVIATPTVTTAPAAESAAVADEAATAAREDTAARRLRGLAGTIATSDRGVLTPLANLPQTARKTLLGE